MALSKNVKNLNDAYFLKNYKGISNIGKTENENLGLSKFASANFKIS